uniref:Uncharacterized protein n=1 Tax=viral metagenome TaxID=1070528 RepID=A0A6M3JZB8_9ZZZZ
MTEARDMLGNYMFYYDKDGDSYNNGDVIAFIEKLDDFLSQNKAEEEPNARS